MIPPKIFKYPTNVFNLAFDLFLYKRGDIKKEDLIDTLRTLEEEEIEEHDFVRVLTNSDLSDVSIEIAIEDLLYEEK